MSAILSADNLNDFISPGVACIKPVETLPAQQPSTNGIYEVTRENEGDRALPAEISLTDCLACSGCVTSAEAVLVSLQSHAEVLNELDASSSLLPLEPSHQPFKPSVVKGEGLPYADENTQKPRIFVASVSPQVRASLAATYGTTEKEAGWMIDQLLGGPGGLAAGGKHRNGFSLVVDTNAMREVALVMEAEEVVASAASDRSTPVKKPVLTSACPGWVCYAEKTHPHILPHMSRIKSPQALTGTLLKTVLSKRLGIRPEQIWHLAVMPCFDKKLEASREELTNTSWQNPPQSDVAASSVRDVDCVITAREILMLADSRGVSFPGLPKKPLNTDTMRGLFDSPLAEFLFPLSSGGQYNSRQQPEAGTSGGFLYHVLRTQQQLHPGSEIQSKRGRNADVIEYTVISGEEVLFSGARYYGFRNIQNLVRKLRPAKASRLAEKKIAGVRQPPAKSRNSDYTYVEVMACPGGCTNGGGLIKTDDLGPLQGKVSEKTQKDWLAIVDATYYSMDQSEPTSDDDSAICLTEDSDLIHGMPASRRVETVLKFWEEYTGISIEKLVKTSFREVHSDVGKPKKGDTEIAEVAVRIGGGW